MSLDHHHGPRYSLVRDNGLYASVAFSNPNSFCNLADDERIKWIKSWCSHFTKRNGQIISNLAEEKRKLFLQKFEIFGPKPELVETIDRAPSFGPAKKQFPSFCSFQFVIFLKKIDLSQPLFIYFRLFYKQFTVNNCTGNWIQTWGLWYRKRPHWQQCHNHCPSNLWFLYAYFFFNLKQVLQWYFHLLWVFSVPMVFAKLTQVIEIKC